MKKSSTRPTEELEAEPQEAQQDPERTSRMWLEVTHIKSGRHVIEVLVEEATERLTPMGPLESIRLWEAIKGLPEFSRCGAVSKEVFDSQAEWLMRLCREAETAENNYNLAREEMITALSVLAVEIMRQKPLAAFDDIVEDMISAYNALPELDWKE